MIQVTARRLTFTCGELTLEGALHLADSTPAPVPSSVTPTRSTAAI